jgi:DNA-directed RNA polymerase specialized sigma24 family protein
MPPSPPEPRSAFRSSGPEYFATTHWSVVLTAGQSRAPGSSEALEELCRAYWYPLYTYVRRRGYGPHDAQDMTQKFFSRFLEKHYLKSVARERGKFRSFLLASMNHFLANEWDRVKAQKRGGRVEFVSIDGMPADSDRCWEIATNVTPEKVYERQWALTLLDLVLTRLREEFAATGKAELFDDLKPFLTGDKSGRTYGDVAAQSRTTEGAVKTAIHRLRRRYRELLHQEVAQTVASPAEVEEELRALLAALN